MSLPKMFTHNLRPLWHFSIILFTVLLNQLSATASHSHTITFEPSEETLSLRHGPEIGLIRSTRHVSFHSDKVSFGFGSTNLKESGPWNSWSALSECSRVCGGGVQYQTRVCLDHINPNNCVGPSTRYFSCNIQNCPVETDFRADQCSRFDAIPFENRYHKWIPYTRGANPCQLNCRPENERFFVPLAKHVIDGTRCYQNESTDICVEGQCVELGCDRILGSGLREDKCRVCGGDGSTCRTVEGVEQQMSGFQSGYNDLLLIPAGATNIRIREIKPTNNYLAVRALRGKFYLNGDWHVRQSGAYQFAGAKFYYNNRRKAGTNNIESLTSLGPTSEPLLIVLLHQEPNQGIAYEYSVPYSVYQPLPNGTAQANQAQGSKYAWIFGDFGQCSRDCGTGIQKRKVFCGLVNHDTGKQEPVKDDLCDLTNRPIESRTCHNDAPCPATWFVGQWDNCSCVHQKQQRNVFCTSGQTNDDKRFESDCPVLPEENCASAGPKPLSIQGCRIEICPQWLADEWSECDSNCGPGTHERTVRCGFPGSKRMSKSLEMNEQKAVAPHLEDLKIMPTKRSVEATTLPPLSEEVATETTQEASADEQTKEKHLIEDDIFVDDSMCDPESKPESAGVCFKKPCDDQGSVEWIASKWSSCEGTDDCSSKMSTRSVQCVDSNGQVWDDAVCLQMHGGVKPNTKQECGDRYVCSKSFWFTSKWSPCSDKSDSAIRTRHVLCAHLDESNNNFVLDDDESKCESEPKPATSETCEQPKEEHTSLFLGPYGSCSKPCGGGSRKRSAFCIQNTEGKSTLVEAENCKEESADVELSQQCNTHVCDADKEAQLMGCENTPFGCCPTDYTTPADEDLRNCPNAVRDDVICDDSEFGCCPTKTQVALGPFGLGCSVNCENTKFGCCPEDINDESVGRMMANTSDKSDCPKPYVEVPTTTLAPTTTEVPQQIEETLVKAESSKCEGNQCSQVLIPAEKAGGVVDCSSSNFGCCPDGWTIANGPDGEGCDEGSGDEGPGDGFFTTTMASVINFFTTVPTRTELESVTEMNVSESAGITESATVLEDEEDCHKSEFGCCPNGKKKASGERYYGCTCHDYPHGCCQDNFSPASGDNFEGCLCSRMLYGCCPDGNTPATGHNNEGCTCDKTPHGCCPDMVNAARGPDHAGCPCDSLTYGCCPGSSIPATGPNFQGCSCNNTPFGCCPNGVTVAFGPNYKGCPSGPSLNLNLNSEVCGLQMQEGSCRNFTVKWYFDVNHGSCNRFWYGGCEGNGNRFQSQEMCERACVKPEGIERCTLPMVRGPCNETQEAWHYNLRNSRCEPFKYGGCLGNTNRFESRRQCEEHCVYGQQRVGDVCDQSTVHSAQCQNSEERWTYRREDGRCYRISYCGHSDSNNLFRTQDECQNSCVVQSPHEICALPKAEGPCLGNFPRWHFDSISGVCREFVYTGCEGNKNRFVDRQSCERSCNQTLDSDEQNRVIPEIPVPGPRVTEGWENVCALPKAEGSCRASIIQWYYNSMNQRCERFYYGGCEGNANRFDDRESCESRCVLPINTHVSDPCLEPKETGNCSDFSIQWYFEVLDGTCHRFYYSGCGGNRNRFLKHDDCISKCEKPREAQVSRPATALPPVPQESSFRNEFCFKNFDYGTCDQANYIRLYYDHSDGVCKEFIYGGCGGNENRFESQIECQTRCWNSQDICKLKSVRGSCSANFTQWFFDYNSNECFEFQYSGCQGNANRFSSKSTCENQCQRKSDRHQSSLYPVPSSPSSSVTDVTSRQEGSSATSSTSFYSLPQQCTQPANPGRCRGYFQRWFYSTKDHQCQLFIYGGCGGNDNRFETAAECQSTCRPRDDWRDTQPKDNENRDVVCRLPAQPGPCEQTQIKWYYEQMNHTCVPFAYGGCRGNRNRFQTFEDCIGLCGGIMNKDLDQPIVPPVIVTPEPASIPTPKPVEVQPRPQPPSQVQIPSDCPPMDCSEDRCSLGIDHYHDSRGCPSCRCTNPCNDYLCPQDMSCALELYLNEQGQVSGRTECRLNVKPGQCPAANQIMNNSQDETLKCSQQCRSDAHCRGNDKCCHNGCTYVCAQVANATMDGSVYERPSVSPKEPHEADGGRKHEDNQFGGEIVDQSIPVDISETVAAGKDALLNCPVDMSHGPVAWTRNNQPIYDSTNTKYDIAANGSLHIKNLNLNDNAIYTCHQNEVAIGKNIRLQIEAPARIHSDSSTRVIGHLGESVYLYCNSLGFPVPRVTWLRNESALQIDGNKYMQFGNNTLLIQNVEAEDSGIYTCQASNGIGSPANWEVVLLLDVGSSANDLNIVPYDPSINQISAPSKPSSSLDRIGVEIKLIPDEYVLGINLQIKCVVRSQITGEVINPTLLSSISWYFNSEIPLVNEPNQHKYRIGDNNSTLTVNNLAKTDSGKYRCRASTGPFADASAFVPIQVEHVYVPPNCQDSPKFRNCDMIVKANFCQNRHYANYCCRSCYLAGIKPK